MKISGLEVEGYGVWSGLRVVGLSDGLNVLFGPNEAGKTTLLQFIRSVLYGFSSGRRKYLPPVRGGRGGGSLDVAGANGRFHLDRREEDAQPDGSGELTLTAEDGARHGEHLLRVLLCEVDEPLYRNVFAVGLREMQELATLSDTDAAELLYSLTAGLDRVSLLEVMRELETSRNRLLHRDGGHCQVRQLLEQREKLRQRAEELGKLTGRYARLAADRDRLEREIGRLEEENERMEREARVVELAITVRSLWRRRAELDDQLAALGPTQAVPERALDRLDALNARAQKHQARIEQLRGHREQLRSEAARLSINRALWRQAARVEALQEQQPWITSLRTRIAELEREAGQIQDELAAEKKRLGLEDQTATERLARFSADSLRPLRPAARALKHCRGRVIEAKQAAASAREQVQSLTAQIQAALTPRGEDDLATAIDRAGNFAGQLRRRLQADERLEEMARYQKQLEEQSRRLVERQLLPVWVLFGLGAVFVMGVVFVMAGLFMPTSVTGSLGWLMALLGLGGAALAGGGKFLLERSNARQLEACQRQIEILQLQIQQAAQERDALEAQIPGGGGSLAHRLQSAEADLATLEELVPVDTRRRAAQQETDAAGGRLSQAEGELAWAERQWHEALATAGLPQGLAPKQVRQLARGCEGLGQLLRRLEHRREELGHRRRELDALRGRIAQLASDAGIEVSAEDPLEELPRLAEALSRQEAAVERRELLRRQARGLRKKAAIHARALGRLKRRRRRLFDEAGAEDEQEFRQRAVEAARAELLRQQREAATREISAALGEDGPEEAVEKQLRANTPEGLEARRDDLLGRLESLEQQLRQRFESRGQLVEQLKSLAEDSQMAATQLELATVERRLEQAIHRWQGLALTCRILETIRTTYEQERQPETLQEASRYLHRLTRGRYRRVWTPLHEDSLRVDDAQGESRPLELLSRGTREQLFLCLRLALAGCYARRGAPLPLVLDDVLVNFDAERAEAAAELLRDFAAAGHQVLVFTCHEHILQRFESLQVAVCRLPDNAQTDPPPVALRQPAKKRSRRGRKPAAKPAANHPEDRRARVSAAEEHEAVPGEIADDQPSDDRFVEPLDAEVAWDEDADDENGPLDGDFLDAEDAPDPEQPDSEEEEHEPLEDSEEEEGQDDWEEDDEDWEEEDDQYGYEDEDYEDEDYEDDSAEAA